MRPTKFRAEILTGHKGAAVEVPFDPQIIWRSRPQTIAPGRRGHTAKGTMNRVAFESFIVPRSKKFFLLISDSLQKSAGVSIGDLVNFELLPGEKKESSAKTLKKK